MPSNPRGDSVSEYSAVPRVNMGRDGLSDTSADMTLQTALLDAVSEAISAAILVYDRNDQLIFASRPAQAFIPLEPGFLKPGIRLRDLLSALYDTGWRGLNAGEQDPTAHNKEEWLSRQIAAHWKERLDIQLFDEKRRWTRYSKRRLPSGYGICVMSDITEQKKRDDQWRADVERVQLTEEILDNLAHPVFVQDRDLAIVAVNKALSALLNVSVEASLGAGLGQFFDQDIARRLTTVARHVLECGQTEQVTIRLPSGYSEPVPLSVHIQRVGKPGRYFVVSSLGVAADQEMPGLKPNAAAAPDRSPDTQRGTTSPRLSGRKALLVTRDAGFETSALEALEKLGLDSCCVRDETELDAFLTVANSVGVTVDLAVVDVQMDVGCLGLIQSFELDYVTLESYQVQSELSFIVMDRLTALQSVPAPADDWEIDTGSDHPARTSGPSTMVLVAEDNPINQIVFSQILEGLGFAYRIAATGAEVIRLAGELNPAVILMDITLPDLNGFEAARRIRDGARQSGLTVPIIGVLPQALDRDRENCFAAGMSDVILKPLSPDILEGAIRRVLPANTTASAR